MFFEPTKLRENKVEFHNKDNCSDYHLMYGSVNTSLSLRFTFPEHLSYSDDPKCILENYTQNSHLTCF